jgi:hypothetical protein
MRIVRFTTKECDFIERVLEDIISQDLDETGEASTILMYLETTAGRVSREEELEGV